MFQFEHAEFRYEPFPIGVIRPLMDEASYREMVESYPPKDLFVHLPKVGHKYTLSEKFNAETYQRFVEETPFWRRLRAWIKSPDFVESVDRMLCQQHIDLGLSKLNVSEAKKWRIAWKEIKRGRFPRLPPGLRARFEFSMLPADGGHIMPHTDTPKKLITLIVSAMRDGEWDPAFGGGTEVNRTKDKDDAFNWLNKTVPFEKIDVLDVYDFAPNQCVTFVKTFNSLHCVRPMLGKGSDVMRKTLTINIERDE